jgi:hypothetical protein
LLSSFFSGSLLPFITDAEAGMLVDTCAFELDEHRLLICVATRKMRIGYLKNRAIELTMRNNDELDFNENKNTTKLTDN